MTAPAPEVLRDHLPLFCYSHLPSSLFPTCLSHPLLSCSWPTDLLLLNLQPTHSFPGGTSVTNVVENPHIVTSSPKSAPTICMMHPPASAPTWNANPLGWELPTPSCQCHAEYSKVLLLFGTANTTLIRNTSKAPKESKRIGGVKTMPSVLCVFQFLFYFVGKVLFLFFIKPLFLFCTLYLGLQNRQQSWSQWRNRDCAF